MLVDEGQRGVSVYIGERGVHYFQGADGAPISAKDPWSNLHNWRDPRLAAHRELMPQDVLDEVNRRLQQPRRAQGIIPLTLGIAALLSVMAWQMPDSCVGPILCGAIILVLIPGFYIVSAASKQETLARTTILEYQLQRPASDALARWQHAAAHLSSAHAFWTIPSSTPTWDSKRNAGARLLLTRQPARFGLMAPPFIRTNTPVYGLALSDASLFFLPDMFLIFSGGKYEALSYGMLGAFAEPIRFIETDSVPSDTPIVRHTWQYVNKNGAPDLRFSGNRPLPVVEYGHLTIWSEPRLHVHLHVSNFAASDHFARASYDYFQAIITRYGRVAEGAGDNQRQDRTAKEAPPRHQRRHTYYQTPPNGGPGQQQQKARQGNAPPQEGRQETPGGVGPQPGQGQQRDAPRNPSPPPKMAKRDPYTVLGVKPTATRDEVMAAFRAKARTNHPDQVADMDFAFRRLAEDRMKEINEAYAELKHRFDSSG